MRVALTGTPGTGKTTIAQHLDDDLLEVVDIGELIDRDDLIDAYDADRDTAVVDLDALIKTVADMDDVLFESHYAHRIPVDRAVVLRCHPTELERRLRGRGVDERSARENAEAEALDVILAEAVDALGANAVVEVDTTGREIADVTTDVRGAIRGDIDPRSGIVDFTEYL